MTKKTTIEVTTAVAAAAANVAALETKHATAQQESTRAQALALALPGRLAAADETVTTADLIQAGPAAAVAQAKATAVARELETARAVLEQARAAELVARLRSGEPFIQPKQVGEELDRIAALVLRELAKLGNRIQEHNAAFYAVAGSLPKGTHVFPAGPDGDRVTVHHEYSGRIIELDGQTWTDMAHFGLGSRVLSRVEMAEAVARDAARAAALAAG